MQMPEKVAEFRRCFSECGHRLSPLRDEVVMGIDRAALIAALEFVEDAIAGVRWKSAPSRELAMVPERDEEAAAEFLLAVTAQHSSWIHLRETKELLKILLDARQILNWFLSFNRGEGEPPKRAAEVLEFLRYVSECYLPRSRAAA